MPELDRNEVEMTDKMEERTEVETDEKAVKTEEKTVETDEKTVETEEKTVETEEKTVETDEKAVKTEEKTGNPLTDNPFYCGICPDGFKELEVLRSHYESEEHKFFYDRKILRIVPGLGFCQACLNFIQSPDGWITHKESARHKNSTESLKALGMEGDWDTPRGCQEAGELGDLIEDSELDNHINMINANKNGIRVGVVAMDAWLIGLKYIKQEGGNLDEFTNYKCTFCDVSFRYTVRFQHLNSQQHRLGYMKEHYPDYYKELESLPQQGRARRKVNKTIFFCHKINLLEEAQYDEETKKMKDTLLNVPPTPQNATDRREKETLKSIKRSVNKAPKLAPHSTLPIRGGQRGPMRGGPMRGGPMRGGPVSHTRGGPMGQIRGGPIWDGPMRDGPMRGGPMRDGPMRGGPMRGGPMRGGSMRGGSMRGGPMRDGPMRGGPMRGGPMRGGPMRGCPMGPMRGDPNGRQRGGPMTRGPMRGPLEPMRGRDSHMRRPHPLREAREPIWDEPMGDEAMWEEPMWEEPMWEEPMHDGYQRYNKRPVEHGPPQKNKRVAMGRVDKKAMQAINVLEEYEMKKAEEHVKRKIEKMKRAVSNNMSLAQISDYTDLTEQLMPQNGGRGAMRGRGMHWGAR